MYGGGISGECVEGLGGLLLCLVKFCMLLGTAGMGMNEDSFDEWWSEGDGCIEGRERLNFKNGLKSFGTA